MSDLKLATALRIAKRIDLRPNREHKYLSNAKFSWSIVRHSKPIKDSEVIFGDIFVLPGKDIFMEIYVFDGPYIVGEGRFGREATEEEYNYFKKGIHLRSRLQSLKQITKEEYIEIPSLTAYQEEWIDQYIIGANEYPVTTIQS